MNVLYISYDGIIDNLGQSQVIPYIRGLARKNINFTLLSFEKKIEFRAKTIKDYSRDKISSNIDWVPLKYHKTPSLIVTLYDIIHGFFVCFWLTKKKKFKIIHGRSFVGSIIGLLLKKIFKIKVIFDIRGFWPEERVEAGLWRKDSWLFKTAKFTEKALILNADEIVVLTLQGKKEIEKLKYLKNKKININIIPTCVDTNNNVHEKANDSILNNLKLNNEFVISYIGSVSTWYMPMEMFQFFDVARKIINNSSFLILTKEDKFLENILSKAGSKRDNISILNVEHKLVPQYLSIAKIGLAFYKPGYSRKACCPVKFGEYLSQGLPVIINAGIGDCDEIIFKEKIGVVINEFSVEEYGRAVHELLNLLSEEDALRQRCKEVAKKYFSLEMGIDRYSSIYKRMISEVM